MKQSLNARLEQLARLSVPMALSLLLLLLSALPYPLPYFAMLCPAVPIIAVYYWALHAPEALPIWAAFLLGLAADVLAAGPLGLTAFVLVAAHGLTTSQRRALRGNAAPVLWVGFIVVAVVAALLHWAGASLMASRPLSPLPQLLQLVVTVLAYPFGAALFATARRRFLAQA